MPGSISEWRYIGLAISIIILTVVYIPVCYSDYAYLDEAHQLWHNWDHSNYSMFFVQGRWLSGFLFDKVFSMASLVADLKFIRVLSLVSWALFLTAWFNLGKKWQEIIGFNKLLLLTGGAFIASSLSVTIYIGWASCFHAGLATLMALWGGSILFEKLTTKQPSTAAFILPIPFVILLGLGSLFLYQIAFGAFLIPFALYLITKKNDTPAKIIYSGVAAYLIITVLYYALFIQSIHHSGVVASGRTDFSFNILGKFGFFFGMPLSQAFSFNFLYNTHSIISQAFPFLMILLWLIVWMRPDKVKPLRKIAAIAGFIALCMFIYLPLMVGKENFSSYRTMFTINMVVSFLLMDAVLLLVKAQRQKLIATVMIALFTIAACWNYWFNFNGPLKQEFKLLKNEFAAKYYPGVDTIFFLRPPENAFFEAYEITSYKDEFGLPSTYKEWTPEPLIKQLILEKTHNRSIAEKLTIIQFTDKVSFQVRTKTPREKTIYIDGEALFQKKP